MNRMVLDCEKGAKDGHHIIIYEKHGKDNQIWFDDPTTGTIRSKADPKLCLDVDRDHLVLKPFQQGNVNQQWHRDGAYIRNRFDKNKVVDVLQMKKEKGSKVGVYKYNGGENQQWEFVMAGGSAPQAPGAASAYAQAGKRDFFIVSELCDKVLDVAGEKAEPGTKVVTWDKHTPVKKNQLWYCDSNGYIRSCLNDMTFCNAATGDQLKMQMPDGNPRNQWMFDGKKVVNRAGESLDIRGAHKDNGAEVISYQYKDQANQHWRQVFYP